MSRKKVRQRDARTVDAVEIAGDAAKEAPELRRGGSDEARRNRDRENRSNVNRRSATVAGPAGARVVEEVAATAAAASGGGDRRAALRLRSETTLCAIVNSARNAFPPPKSSREGHGCAASGGRTRRTRTVAHAATAPPPSTPSWPACAPAHHALQLRRPAWHDDGDKVREGTSSGGAPVVLTAVRTSSTNNRDIHLRRRHLVTLVHRHDFMTTDAYTYTSHNSFSPSHSLIHAHTRTFTPFTILATQPRQDY